MQRRHETGDNHIRWGLDALRHKQRRLLFTTYMFLITIKCYKLKVRWGYVQQQQQQQQQPRRQFQLQLQLHASVHFDVGNNNSPNQPRTQWASPTWTEPSWAMAATSGISPQSTFNIVFAYYYEIKSVAPLPLPFPHPILILILVLVLVPSTPTPRPGMICI